MSKFDENIRVKIPATIHFLRLGYEYQSLSDIDVNIDINTKIFINRFKPSISKINNKEFSDDDIKTILDDINKILQNNDMGKEFYSWLISPQDKVKLIDFDNLNNNDFAIVDELPFKVSQDTKESSFRPDINILINGVPLAFLEVKKPNNDGGIQKEFNRMINDRLQNPKFKKYFNLLQIISFSNNMEYESEDCDDVEDIKAGSFYTTPNGDNTTFSFFREDSSLYFVNYNYKNISKEEIEFIVKDCKYKSFETNTPEFQENLSVITPCNRFITSLFDKERLLYFLQYGIMYVNGRIPEKRIMRYPQFFATKKIIERLESGEKRGIIWHTQGSGKTDLSAFANRIIRDYYLKKNISTRFFFVVDRLELLTQASIEFTNCGLSVTNCKNKKEFTNTLNQPLSTNIGLEANGEVCVVNIQKFSEVLPIAKNDYNVNIQRIFFVDEAHRSYKMAGQYFRNLITCDPNGVFIALTGTPLLTKAERSNLKFGDYIHKYFYDKSIADGYTLRIKKENISTIARTEIKRNLKLEDKDINDKSVYESDDYVDNLSRFIDRDFQDFRLINGNDKTIGGMIVCRSNKQAKMVHEWFNNHSSLSTGLVMTDEDNPEQNLINKNNQLEFKEEDSKLDMLVVNIMLTTGYDVKRLKKMYLLREPHSHTLLQTISRVNRPYKSPIGKTYKYGYIVDFVDIEKEYDRTLESYIKELEDEFNENRENEGSLTNLVIDVEEFNNKYHQYVEDLNSFISTDNLELFSRTLSNFNKETLFKVRKDLIGINECYAQFILSNKPEYAEQVNFEKNKNLLKIVKERINFLNLKENPVDVMNIISNDEIVEILYEFIKAEPVVLNLENFDINNSHIQKFTDVVMAVQNEIKINKNRNDVKIRNLDELLHEIFEDLSISDIEDVDEITNELLKALKDAKEINDKNEQLSSKYGGNYAFVKTYQDAIQKYSIDEKDIENLLEIIYDEIKDVMSKDIISVQGRKNFIDSIKAKITIKILMSKDELYKKIKDIYDEILSDLYTNIKYSD